jgi:hypothetical protein
MCRLSDDLAFFQGLYNLPFDICVNVFLMYTSGYFQKLMSQFILSLIALEEEQKSQLQTCKSPHILPILATWEECALWLLSTTLDMRCYLLSTPFEQVPYGYTCMNKKCRLMR